MAAQLYECDTCHELKGYRLFAHNRSTNWKPASTCKLCMHRQLTARGEKQCTICGETKSLADFFRDARRHDGYFRECRLCVQSSRRESFMRRRYGIGQQEYDAMYAAQDGRCMICSERPSADAIRLRKDRKRAPRIIKTELYVDHDHVTGAVRGLLCPNCNRLIGLAYDNTDVLRSALDYLAYFRKEQTA